MDPKALALREALKAQFKSQGLATIKDIPTERFNELLGWLTDQGWVKTYEYDGFDAWIDYGRVEFQRGETKVLCEWDNWTEGSFEGPRAELVVMADAHTDLKVTDEWRWAEYDRS